MKSTLTRSVAIAACALIGSTALAQAPAFPGAEGNGRYTTGGRGGNVVHVTNLNDSGTGSLRAAVSGTGKKIVVFDVGGVIALNSDLKIGANTTILGQTAPYPGITLRYYTVEPGANNIIRFIRVRRGQEKDVNDGADAIWNRNLNSLILDHCSFSWSIDEVASFYDNNNFTMQWCTVGESLNNAGHDKGAHGYGGIWGGKLASFHHNMITHTNNRSPRFNGARYNWTGYTQNSEYSKYNWQNAVQAENVDFRNCLIFDWGGGGCYGGPGGGYINMVNNYYKASPETSNKNRVTTVSIANSTTSADETTYLNMTSRYYINGNYVNGYGANYDWSGVKYDTGVQTINGAVYTLDSLYYYGREVEHVNNSDGIPCVSIKLDAPAAPTGEVTTHSAETAYTKILAYGGASLFRDDVDNRYMTEVKNGASTYKGSVTGKLGQIDVVADCDGYTENNFPTGARANDFDTDGDGMPDVWEKANGLDPNSNVDATTYSLDPKGYYTNIEVYANHLVEDIMRNGNADAVSAVDEYYPAVNKVDGLDYYTGRVVERVAPTTPEENTTPIVVDDVVATWDFQHMASGAVAIQGTTGTVNSDVEGVVLTVDATSGKLQSRGSDAQFNAGTIIRVPVASAKDSVYVTSYPGYHNYTVGGIAATENTTAYKASTTDATQGYVEVRATATSYLYSIRVVQASKYAEKLIYTTTFTNWTDAAAATTESTVTQQTKYSHETLNFSIYNTQVSSTNKNVAKFPNWTGGYLMASKSADPYVTTTKLASISKVHFLHGATGSNRGWKLEAKGDGDTDWVVLSSSVATIATGTDVDVDVNRTNCQLRFTNLNSAQNAYLFQLDIYGYVDMSKTPALGTLSVNGTTYHAADVFTEDADGNYSGTIEVSKTQPIISDTNPLTNLVADNGEVGTVVYTTTANGTTATIPVAANGETVNYVANFVLKPDFTLTYYNTDGTTIIGTQQVEKDASIAAFKYAAADATVSAGKAFRGWFAAPAGTGNRKFTTDDVITANKSLYGLATEVETQSTTKRYVFRLTDQYFYDEDHEAFDLKGSGKFHDGTHGWQFANGDSLRLLVGGNAYIVSQLCRYGNTGTITVVNSKGTTLTTIDTPASTDGELSSYYYEGPADTLTMVFNGAPYLHALTIVNVQDQPIARNDAGYYVVKAGDADNLLSTIEVANANAGDSRTYIFLPKGRYDLGETVLTPISGNNISIIGEDRDATIVVNAPKVANEGIGTTATFLVTGHNTYFQDLTLQNALDYYASGSAGRAVVLQDKGNRTICKNVKMLSYQDTYYSNADGQYYFEDGEIHGTVDYLCGSGDVYFNRVRLVNESRTATGKTGEDVIAAPYPGSGVKYGYVFESCVIENNASAFSLGRAWGGQPMLTYLNTTILQPTEIIATRFTTAGMNVPAYQFKEYGSVDANGAGVTPVSNVQTFTKDNLSNTFNTTMSADSAALFSLDKVFPDWAPAELTAQVKLSALTLAEDNTLTWQTVDDASGYAVFADGQFVTIVTGTSYAADPAVKVYSVKAANTMGGFGEAATIETPTSISVINAGDAISTEYYSTNGMRLAQPQRGVNIRVTKMANGSVKTEKVVVK